MRLPVGDAPGRPGCLESEGEAAGGTLLWLLHRGPPIPFPSSPGPGTPACDVRVLVSSGLTVLGEPLPTVWNSQWSGTRGALGRAACGTCEGGGVHSVAGVGETWVACLCRDSE